MDGPGKIKVQRAVTEKYQETFPYSLLLEPQQGHEFRNCRITNDTES